jgi:hypothetical protein
VLLHPELVVNGVRDNRILIKVAGIVFSISSDLSISAMSLGEAYRDFVCTSDEPEVVIHASYDGLSQVPLRAEDRIFDSEGTWSLYGVDEQYVFALRSPLFGPHPYCIAVFSPDFRRGEVYNRVVESESSTGDLLPKPLEFPLSEVLMVCLLARGRGVMVHACGIEDGGHGYLFAGNSTHGKTTMSRIWKDQALVLNDDRIVLRRHEGRFYMHGTPWHGAFPGVAARRVPLDKVFFLRHDERNSASPKQGAAASSMLMARGFLPFWDEGGMRFTLDFCAELVESVPCYELGFMPDDSVIRSVRCVK